MRQQAARSAAHPLDDERRENVPLHLRTARQGSRRSREAAPRPSAASVRSGWPRRTRSDTGSATAWCCPVSTPPLASPSPAAHRSRKSRPSSSARSLPSRASSTASMPTSLPGNVCRCTSRRSTARPSSARASTRSTSPRSRPRTSWSTASGTRSRRRARRWSSSGATGAACLTACGTGVPLRGTLRRSRKTSTPGIGLRRFIHRRLSADTRNGITYFGTTLTVFEGYTSSVCNACGGAVQNVVGVAAKPRLGGSPATNGEEKHRVLQCVGPPARGRLCRHQAAQCNKTWQRVAWAVGPCPRRSRAQPREPQHLDAGHALAPPRQIGRAHV